MPHKGVLPKPVTALQVGKQQRLALLAIRDHIKTHKVSPTYEELAKALGCSKWTARDFVLRLCVGGYVRRTLGVHRNLTVTRAGHGVLAKALAEKQEAA